jgi:hypothetical protein
MPGLIINFRFSDILLPNPSLQNPLCFQESSGTIANSTRRLELILLQDRHHLSTNFLVIAYSDVYNPALFPCSNKMAQSLTMMMAPSSNSSHQLRWFSPARTHHLSTKL